MHGEDPRSLSVAELVSLCASDTSNAELWAEFLLRYAPRIRAFVRKTLRMFNGSATLRRNTEESDLVQNAMMRLVENECALLKRFEGGEMDFVACLAVVAQSAVLDSLRRQSAAKRKSWQSSVDLADVAEGFSRARTTEYAAERHVLANEAWVICLRMIRNLSGSSSRRDKRIFELHYSQGLTVHEIARVKEVGMSKTGVENVLNRLTDRVRATLGSIEEREQ